MANARLPQEIIDLIIDEVAREESQARLKACSLVSRSFLLPSRRHIFSHLEFSLDFTDQSRAARLLEVLRPKHKSDLVSIIRSLKITLTAQGVLQEAPRLFRKLGLQRAFLKSRRNLSILLLKLGVKDNSQYKLLDLFSQLPLESLSLEGRGWFFWWLPLQPSDIDSRLFRLCSSSSLRALHLFNIHEAPKSLLIAITASSSLQDLRLSNVHFDGEASLSSTPAPSSNSLAKIENLQLTFLPSPQFFDLLRSILPSSDLVFPSLRTFKLSSTRYGNWEALKSLMLYSMPSLETLEFWEDKSTLNHMVYNTHASYDLHHIPSLRNVKFIISCYETGSDFEAKQMALARFFAALTSPTTITSLVVDFYAEKRLQAEPSERPTLGPGPGWVALDQALCTSAFAELRTVFISVKAFYGPGLLFVPSNAETLVEASFLTPRLADCAPWLNVKVSLETVSSPEMNLFHYLNKHRD